MLSIKEKLQRNYSLALKLADLLEQGILDVDDDSLDLIYSYVDGLTQKRIYDMIEGRGSPKNVLAFDLIEEEKDIDKSYKFLKRDLKAAHGHVRKNSISPDELLEKMYEGRRELVADDEKAILEEWQEEYPGEPLPDDMEHTCWDCEKMLVDEWDSGWEFRSCERCFGEAKTLAWLDWAEASLMKILERNDIDLNDRNTAFSTRSRYFDLSKMLDEEADEYWELKVRISDHDTLYATEDISIVPDDMAGGDSIRMDQVERILKRSIASAKKELED